MFGSQFDRRGRQSWLRKSQVRIVSMRVGVVDASAKYRESVFRPPWRSLAVEAGSTRLHKYVAIRAT